MNEFVVCVDSNDKQIGLMEKMEAHKLGKLHRAFSVFIFNEKKEMLLQKRASIKYHSPNLWTNTCCSHPRENESIEDAASRRLVEEMGITCDTKEIFSFKYYVDFKDGLIENEYDHVRVGYYNGEVLPNNLEVDDYKWISLKEIKRDILDNPQIYTFWFKYIIENYSVKFENI